MTLIEAKSTEESRFSCRLGGQVRPSRPAKSCRCDKPRASRWYQASHIRLWRAPDARLNRSQRHWSWSKNQGGSNIDHPNCSKISYSLEKGPESKVPSKRSTKPCQSLRRSSHFRANRRKSVKTRTTWKKPGSVCISSQSRDKRIAGFAPASPKPKARTAWVRRWSMCRKGSNVMPMAWKAFDQKPCRSNWNLTCKGAAERRSRDHKGRRESNRACCAPRPVRRQ